jgi:hydroxymethylbilane synthase
MELKIGTRGSRLALIQTQQVVDAILQIAPNTNIETVIITTKGDRILNKSLDKIGDKGLFVAEIEEKLRTGEIDLAIHSMKDLPSTMDEALDVLPILKREDPRDVLVTRHPMQDVNDLTKSPIIGTGSQRRQHQLLRINPNIEIVPIRGNVETRIQKMLDQTMDGTVLAYAGINRLGLISNAKYRIIPFHVQEMIPAPAQGIIGCQLRKDQQDIRQLMEQLVDPMTKRQCDVERLFLKEVQGSCHLPMGAYLEILNEEEGRIYGIYGDQVGQKVAREEQNCRLDEAEATMKALAYDLVRKVKG